MIEDKTAITARIMAFLEQIGIAVRMETVSGDTLLPAMTIDHGALVFDPDRLTWPGDLLHEAGHIAVTDPALRPALCEVPNDPAEEMATICWSYAAALAIGLDAAIVFHDGGYKGGGESIRNAFAQGAFIGSPMLAWYGMTSEPKRGEPDGPGTFPQMHRWLR